MKHDRTNIELIAQIIQNNKTVTKEMNFQILSQTQFEHDIVYEASIYSEIYEIHIPPAVLLYNGKKKIFIEYMNFHLS